MQILKQENIYKVESSKKGKFYIVDLNKRTCTCPHFIVRLARVHGMCKHMQAVKDKIEKRDDKTYESIIDYVKDKEIDSLELINKFGEDVVDDMLSRGELIEKNGMVRVLD
jgi:predicted nucleic acid-binding Zn finger protein|tara:strand:- start:343 stop:675 length:333 start_codon:yes stop_codon:yes gene_type:complete